MKINTIVHTFQSICEYLCTPVEVTPKKCVFYATTASSVVENIKLRRFTANDSKKQCFDWSRTHLFELICRIVSINSCWI